MIDVPHFFATDSTPSVNFHHLIHDSSFKSILLNKALV